VRLLFLRAIALAAPSSWNEVDQNMTASASTPTRQFAGLIVAPIIPSKHSLLLTLLGDINTETIATMRGNPPARPIIPFHELETVHYARFVVLGQEGEGRARLAFCTDYDGPMGDATCREDAAWAHHLEDLTKHALEGLERVFALCEGFTPGTLRQYFEKHRLPAATFYAGASGRSKGQILWEADLRKRIDQIIDAVDLSDVPAGKVGAPHQGASEGQAPSTRPAEDVRQHVLAQLGEVVPPFPAQPDEKKIADAWKWRRLGGILGGSAALVAAAPLVGVPALAMLAGLVGGAGLLVARFRHLEKTDEQFQPAYDAKTHAHLGTAAVGENEFLQNQLTHLVRLKPGRLRRLVVKTVFSALQVRARHLYNKGKLGDIPSIHFARWVLLDNQDVLFFSNFDNSWQSYLGDFIDRASSGLTAVWSNTKGYPRTRWLLRAGSRDASRFLAWTRHHQLPTQVWYCAYPGLSIVNINDNTLIRRGLGDPLKVDATDWLFRLRNVDRVHVDQIAGDEQRSDPSLSLEDIQGLILWGYSEKHDARYLLLRLKAGADTAKVRDWIKSLDINSAGRWKAGAEPEPLFVNIAFSYEGLARLDVDERVLNGFSTAFVQDSQHPSRVRVNGDANPAGWSWGSGDKTVHVALFLFAKDRALAEAEALKHKARAEEAGLEVVTILEAGTLPGRKEHFGFRDGIAQPTIQGSGRAELDGNTLEAGEFLLGHRDGYGNITHSPQSPNGFNVGLNGSYLVLRQLEQKVERFWSYCAEQAPRLGLAPANASGEALADGAIRVASKMVGRWPSGAPLVRHPDADPNDAKFENEDNFNYVRNDEDHDSYGARCPFGAHVRRTNPRDWRMADDRNEAMRISNLHRILRRGRPYGEALDPDMETKALITRALEATARGASNGAGSNGAPSNGAPSNGAPSNGASDGAASAGRGLQFMCFNANIERQFEFVQQQWCNNPKFAGLNNDPDPLLGVPSNGHSGAVLPAHATALGLDAPGFTLQSDARGGVHKRGGALGEFVTLRGSGYFFMPSLPAVRLLAEGLLASTGVPQLEDVPNDEQLHIDSLIATLAAKMKRDYKDDRTLRDGHPKMHGCVKATFRVHGDLPEDLRVGLFGTAQEYPAWVRFSNESGRVSSDDEKDARGVAIKLMGVPGPKLLEGEEDCTTFDFVMTNRPAFFARNAAEFAPMMRALVASVYFRFLPFLFTHPHIRKALKRWRQYHGHVFDIQYFSGVPYLLGQNAVKYSLKPTAAQGTPPGKGRDHLRAGMVTTLSQRDVTFELLVQRRVGDMPIEDATAIWDERESPFIPVATLEIPQQAFDNPERDEFGDNLSFNPWRCLPQHRPLGGLNRARRQVYRALSELRHARNAAPSIEPSPGGRRPPLQLVPTPQPGPEPPKPPTPTTPPSSPASDFKELNPGGSVKSA
jgi:Dyp-type peroxidase family